MNRTVRLKDAAGRWVHDVIRFNDKIVEVEYTENIQNAMLFKEYDPIVFDLTCRGLFVVR